jgi:hypothetical protein
MKIGWLAMAALPVLATSWSWGQERSEGAGQDPAAPKGRLTRVMDERHPDGKRGDGERFDRDAWRKKLAASDLEERERAFDRLSDLARQDEEAREALKEWSKNGQDPELAWTSRMLLREVGRTPWRVQRQGLGSGQSWLGPNFDLDDFGHRFDDLSSMFGDLQSQWQDMLSELPTPSSGSNSSSERLSLKVEPGGVSCKIQSTVDGKEETRTYEAKTMDELLDAHPELRDKLGNRTRFQFQGFGGPGHVFIPRGNLLRLAPHLDIFGHGDEPMTPGEPRTDRLGILCDEIGKDRAAEMGLEPGVGLRVQDVQPGTIASLLGLRKDDVVVEVNGATVHQSGDVKKALKERAADADVAVVVVAPDGHRRTLTWKPKPAADKKTERKSESRDL